MDICSSGHDEIVYDYINCPVCEVMEELEELRKDLESDVKAYAELESRYENLVDVASKLAPEILV